MANEKARYIGHKSKVKGKAKLRFPRVIPNKVEDPGPLGVGAKL
jgi:hypothetical protein